MKALIMTVYDSNYADYAEIFAYCAKKAYPEYDVAAIARESVESDRDIGVLPNNRSTTATLRFCLPDKYYVDYDYVFITDVDILIFREEPIGLVDQHLRVIAHTGFCYENTAVPLQGHGYRMPGVHFAHREWFRRTEESRANLLKQLKLNETATFYEFDEVSLFKICEPLGYTKKGTEQWRWHGIHLGRYCRRHGKAHRPRIGISELAHVADLMQDDDFLELMTQTRQGGECSRIIGTLASMCGAVV